jgi:hypothetical protein
MKLHAGSIVCLGASPQTPWVRFADFGKTVIFREAEQRFLLLFLEKEENYKEKVTNG